MTDSNRMQWDLLSQAFAFLGNSLLAPVRQLDQAGLTEEFWEAFPTFGDDGTAKACASLAALCAGLEERAVYDPVTDVSVEYTHLFVGPPKPSAAPWETMYRGGERVDYGFGRPTFEMRALLSAAGLQLSIENRQYEDHMGIELLYLSVLCQRVTDDSFPAVDYEKVAAYIEAHPLDWIDAFRSAVYAERPEGYFDHLLAVVEALLRWAVDRSH